MNRKPLFICCLLFAVYSLQSPITSIGDCFAEEMSSPNVSIGDWAKTYETQYATIYYSNDNDLNSFTRNLRSGLQIFGESQGKNPMLAKNRVDAIVERVEQILDMYPSNLHFKIYIYPAYKDLSLKYLAIGSFGKSPSPPAPEAEKINPIVVEASVSESETRLNPMTAVAAEEAFIV